ncbi:tape measure protein [Comamonas terrigena]|uniref:tape measure protein n=1 Tax=Comamonas terrigena TaxID=32013 RepID=UPI0028989DB9|nr:tape measure protein [Comamonas terrigena]
MTNEVTSIGVGMETDGIERGIKSLKTLAEQGPKVEQAMAGVERVVKTAGKTLEGLRQSAPDLSGVAAGAAKAGAALGGLGNAARSTIKNSEDLRRALDSLGATEEQYIRKLMEEAKTIGMGRGDREAYLAQSRGMSASAQEVARAIGNKIQALKAEQAATVGAVKGAKEMASANEVLAANMKLAVRGVQALLGLQVVSWAKESAVALFSASAAAERLRTGLDFSSARGSADEIAYLRKTTHALGLQFQSTALAYMQFQAAAKGTSLEGEKARAVFESVAKASTVMGLSAEQSSGVLLALQQMVSKGTVQAEELRGQLGERLPGSLQIAARAMGVTTAELGKMLEQGQLLADDFLPKFAKELESSLGGAAEKAAHRLDAATNRFIDAWDRLKQNVGDSGVSKAAAEGMSESAESLNAISLAMEQARIQGAGFWGQMGAAIGVMHDLTSVTERAKVNMYDNAVATAEAQKELERLQRIAATQGTSAWLLKEIGNVQRYIGELQQARREKDALQGGALVGAYTEGLGTSKTIVQQRAKFEASEQFLLSKSAETSGVTKKFIDDLAGYAAALDSGAMSATAYAAAITDLNKKRYESSEAGKAEAKALKAGAGEAKAAENSYQGLLKAVNEHMAAVKLQMDGSAKLTESQKLQIKYDELLARGKQGASAATIALVQAQIAALAVLEKEQKAIKLNVAGYQEYLALQDELADDYVKQAKAKESLRLASDRADLELQDQIARIELEAQMLGRTAEARQIAVAQLDAEIERRKELEALAKNLDLDESVREEERIRINERYAKKVALAQRKAYVSEWDKTSQLVGDTLADYIMSGGKDAATYLKRLFSTLVLQPIVKAGVSNVMGAIGLGGSASGANVSDLSTAASMVQNGHSLYSALTGSMTYGLGTSLASVGTMIGSSAATSFGAGMAASGFTANAFSTGAGVIAAGNTGAGLGMMAGAALPWVAGIVAIASIAKALDNGGTPHVGAGAVYDDGVLKGDKSTVNVNQAKNWSGTTQTGISSLASTLGGMFDSLSEAFGKGAGWRVETGFSGDGDDKSRGLLSISDANGIAIAGWGGKSGRYSSNVEKAWGQYLEEVSGSTLVALRNIAPAWGDAIIDGATAELDKLSGTDKFEAIAQLAQQIANTKAQLLGLGDAMAMFKDMTDAVEGTLLSVSGGIDALVTNAGQFYDLYYSDAEKQARTMAQLQEVFTKYDADVPATREEYRALVEAQMAAGESGAEFAAVLLGLSSQFAAISDTWAKELSDMSSSVSDFFSDLRESIASAQMDVAGSRKDILRGAGVMSADEIAAAIAGINTAGPSMDGLNAAGAANSAAAAAAAQAQSVRDAYAAAAGQQQSTLSGLQTQRSAAQAQIDAAKQNADATAAWAMDQWLRRRGSHSYRKYTVTAMVEASQAAYAQTLQQMTGAISGLDAAIAQQQGVYDDAAAAAKVYADELAAAQAALAATQQAQVQAQVDYAAAMKDWVVEAGTSVTKLGELRGEVVDFYEAQAAAVQGMLQSAGNLRSVVDQVRLGQLDTAQTAAELGSRYATDYAMALATTGTTRAGYVDSMAGNLQSLSEALKAEAVTGAEWRIQTAKLLAQASNAAGLLEGDAEADDYQDVALGLLGSIDTALESLSAATVSAEQVIADAINAGTAAQLDGLRAIVAALKGDPIPAFAAGGYHAGGLRWVGENGPELEATGPSRIWNQSQLAGALGGGGNSEVLVAEIRALREEQRAQAATIVRLQQDNNRLLMRWETQGLPTERNEV